jgi:hypothetical protein
VPAIDRGRGGNVDVELLDTLPDLEHLDPIRASCVEIGRVCGDEERVTSLENLVAHDRRSGDDVVQAVDIMAVAKQRILGFKPDVYQAEAPLFGSLANQHPQLRAEAGTIT